MRRLPFAIGFFCLCSCTVDRTGTRRAEIARADSGFQSDTGLAAQDSGVTGTDAPPGTDAAVAQPCVTRVAEFAIAPGEDIQAAVNARPEGTSFLLRAGVHRLATVRPKRGNAFYGELSADCRRLTTLSGARLLTTFTPTNGGYAVGGQDQSGQVAGFCADDTRCNYPEDLFIDDVPLLHVANRAQVGPGKWHFDYGANTIYFTDDPAGRRVEIGTTRVAFSPTSPDVTIRDLIIEKYAIPGQMGAIGDQVPAERWTVESNEVRWNHGTGIVVGSRGVIRDNYAHHNGQKGLGATGDDVVIERNEISYNNYAHFSPGWDAGGTKFAFTTRATIRENCVHHNDGNGLWVSLNNRDARIENNTVFSNSDQGILYEISFGAVIRNNFVGQNGERGSWLFGANIMVSTSTDVDVEGNIVEVAPTYGHAIVILWQDRGASYTAVGSRIHDNDVTYLGESGQTAVGTDFAPARPQIYQRNSLNGNRYHMTNLAGQHFGWTDQQRSFEELQAEGQEAAGMIDTTVTRRTWACPAR